MSPAPSDHPKLQEQDRAAFEAAYGANAQERFPNGEYRYAAQAWSFWQKAIAHERARILAALPQAGYVDAAEVRRVVEGER